MGGDEGYKSRGGENVHGGGGEGSKLRGEENMREEVRAANREE